MKKDDILFGIIGILLGFILGFMLTNSFNQRNLVGAPATAGTTGADNAPPEAEAPPDPQVLEAARQKAAAEPSNFETQMQTGDVFYRARRYAEAVPYFTKANELQPEAWEPLVALGNVYYDDARDNEDNSKWPLSEKWYLAALAKQPKNHNIRTDLGLTYVFRKPPEFDRAIKEFKQVLSENPNHEPALQNLIVAYTQKKDLNAAKASLAQLEKINPNNPALDSLREGIETGK